MKLYFFEAGVLKSQKHYFTLNQGVGEAFDVPVPFLLIDHPKGKVLFDTGNAFETIQDAESRTNSRKAVPISTPWPNGRYPHPRRLRAIAGLPSEVWRLWRYCRAPIFSPMQAETIPSH